MISFSYSNLFNKTSVQKITDPIVIDQTYRYWRIRTMYAMYVGYAIFYLTRKSFTFVIPQMIQDLHFTKEQIGILGSVFYITYGISKFISGMLSDKSNPRYFMAFGLMATGIANIFFGFSSSLLCLILFWLINGFFQGWGWPPCARLLTHWYSQSERGRWWGAWNTAHNLGGALIPIIAAASVLFFANWRAAMLVPGVIAIIISFFIFNRLRDVPESQGLPPIEVYRNNHVEKQSKKTTTQPIVKIFFNYVFRNYYIWLLAFSYVFVYAVRMAVNDWGSPFLTEQGYTLMRANSCMSFFEIGGFIGSLVAGWCSDKFFSSLRGQTNVLFSLGVVLLLLCFWFIPGKHFLLHSLVMFGIGFFIFGPQMLIGIAAAELSHREAAGTATGFVGLFGYIGAAISGYPVGLVIDHFGWYGFFISVGICAVLSILLLIPLWQASGYKQLASQSG
ncbi:MAG: MFS transporter family glucose-6-phosphate receptor UhpC [Coxiellaceae bacterium]|jgi:OPA family sugar phosphate sensor protein UhpC-like MFS transporter|nr:MFS transporter family glucose-6-phosphate receptor UhpC [Coxiellaceae bacterium]